MLSLSADKFTHAFAFYMPQTEASHYPTLCHLSRSRFPHVLLKKKKKKFWQSEDFFLKIVYMCTLHVLAVHIKYDVIVSRVKTLHSLKLLCDYEHYNCGFYHTLYIVVAEGKS